jgi:hypothetical protein
MLRLDRTIGMEGPQADDILHTRSFRSPRHDEQEIAKWCFRNTRIQSKHSASARCHLTSTNEMITLENKAVGLNVLSILLCSR